MGEEVWDNNHEHPHPAYSKAILFLHGKRKSMKSETASTPQHQSDALLTPMAVRLSQTAPRCPPQTYEVDPHLKRMTRGTRRINRILPYSLQHKLRDGGYFRSIADAMVTTVAVPMAGISCPSAVREFLDLTHQKISVSYGDHEAQFLDVFFPKESKVRGMIVFVHGGAWGSGKTWMYRLATKPFLKLGLAVALVGYRVYPLCGVPGERGRGGILSQMDDLDAALDKLRSTYPEWCDKNFEDRTVENHPKPIRPHLPHLGTILVGHSSGAHVSMLWMAERAQTDASCKVDGIIALSGVYNIEHHFEYEGGRGVEEISPLKPVNGFDRRSFRKHSPPWKVQNEVLLQQQDETLRGAFPPRILILHGAEDDVVPCAGAGEAARILKASLGGVSSFHETPGRICIDEIYIPKMGHQETVVDLMMLGGHAGPVTKAVTDWLLHGNRRLFEQQQSSRIIGRSKL